MFRIQSARPSSQPSRPAPRLQLLWQSAPRLLHVLVLLYALGLPSIGLAQDGLGVVVEDLEETDVESLEAPPAELDTAALQQLFDEAQATFEAQDPAAFSSFGRLVDLFENHLATMTETSQALAEPADGGGIEPDGMTVPTGTTTPEASPPADEVPQDGTEPGPPPAPPAQRFLDAARRQIFAHSLLYRAILGHDFGEDELAVASLGRLLEISPDFDPANPAEGVAAVPVPADLLDLFAKLQRQRLATVKVTVEPADAIVLVDGREISIDQSQRVMAGSPWIQVLRPGYSPYQQQLDLRAGKTWSEDIVLERLSPVLRLYTRPSGAEVYLDGQRAGTTSGQANPGQVHVGRYRPEEFSSELVLGEIATGIRRLEVRKAGFRPYRAELEVYDLLDYPIPPIVLEGESGLIVFRDFPPGGKLAINGRNRPLDNPTSSRPQLSLPPGEYQLTIESDRSSMFSTQLRLADRQTVEVQVRLRPGLAFLGVIGDDADRRRDLDQALRQAFGRSGKWSILDRSSDTGALLRGLDIDGDALRAEAEAIVVGQHIDWSRLQWSADQRSPGLLYALAVVNDNLLARQATVFLWPAAPGPPVPDRVVLPSGAIGALQRLEEALNRPLQRRRPWLGAVLSNSPMSPHPLVFSVTPGGPAEAAGLQAGDQLIAVSQVPVFSQGDVESRLAAAEVGEVLELGVQRLDGPHALRMTLRASPQVVNLRRPNLLPSVVFADLQVAAEEAGPEEAWLLRLDKGRLLLAARQYEEAVRHLRDVDAPQTSHGFGQAAVDYWLGLALANLDGTYRDAARQAFERAASLPEARLDHHDGPFVAPRAAARLLALGSF